MELMQAAKAILSLLLTLCMKWFVLNSSKETQVSEAIDIEAFRLSTETEKEPSFFEIVFLLEEKTFRYGFEVKHLLLVLILFVVR